MADKVNDALERMIPELEDLEATGIFSAAEIRDIVARRRSHEYQLAVHGPPREAFKRYIAFEASLEGLVRARKKRMGVRHLKAAEGACINHIHNIYNRAVRQYRGDEALWLEWAEFARSKGNSRRLQSIFPRALQLLPTSEALWARAAVYQHDERKDPAAARTLLQRGLRVSGASRSLWLGLFRLELSFAMRLRARRVLLGVEGAGLGDEAAEAERAAAALASGGAAAAAAGDASAEGAEAALERLLEGSVAAIVLSAATEALPSDPVLRLSALRVLDEMSHREAPSARAGSGAVPYRAPAARVGKESVEDAAARLATAPSDFPRVEAATLEALVAGAGHEPAVWAALARRAMLPATAAAIDATAAAGGWSDCGAGVSAAPLAAAVGAAWLHRVATSRKASSSSAARKAAGRSKRPRSSEPAPGTSAAADADAAPAALDEDAAITEAVSGLSPGLPLSGRVCAPTAATAIDAEEASASRPTPGKRQRGGDGAALAAAAPGSATHPALASVPAIALPACVWEALKATDEAAAAALAAGAAACLGAVADRVEAEAAGSFAVAPTSAAATTQAGGRWGRRAVAAAAASFAREACAVFADALSAPLPAGGEEAVARQARLHAGVLSSTAAVSKAASDLLGVAGAAELGARPLDVSAARVRALVALGRPAAALAEAAEVLSGSAWSDPDADSDHASSLAIATADAAAAAVDLACSGASLAAAKEPACEVDWSVAPAPAPTSGSGSAAAAAALACLESVPSLRDAARESHAAICPALAAVAVLRAVSEDPAAPAAALAWAVWEARFEAEADAAEALALVLCACSERVRDVPAWATKAAALPAGFRAPETVVSASVKECCSRSPGLASDALEWFFEFLGSQPDAAAAAAVATATVAAGSAPSVAACAGAARVCEGAGDTDGAVAAWERACRAHGTSDPAAWTGMAKLLRRAGRVAEASDAVQRGCRALGDRSGALLRAMEEL
ncbi:hypothetical protein FNF28_04306 [Cafeteria roenbergensis]|uniref:U3 small nucleolar RNA-associated protein 6 N-terminal domain-containing protein n=1 Tax=Cafeteria roenbergensis TaxID=33653 RepID=A0A5A8DEB0_CAFRO|nr:hypothetical protein FNF28_04306 [Cafeteria roenbergensis]